MEQDIKTKQCKHCKKEIDAMATRCPHCQGKNYVWTTSKKVIAVCLGIFLFMAFSGIFSSSSPSTTSESQGQTSTVSRKITSIAFAKSVIEGVLKSPSTAKFSSVEAYELSNEKDVWSVNGYVDSQNGFGAMLRNVWEVKLDYRDGKGGEIMSVMFDGKKVQ